MDFTFYKILLCADMDRLKGKLSMLGCQNKPCRNIDICQAGKRLTMGLAVSNKTDELPKEIQGFVK